MWASVARIVMIGGPVGGPDSFFGHLIRAVNFRPLASGSQIKVIFHPGVDRRRLPLLVVERRPLRKIVAPMGHQWRNRNGHRNGQVQDTKIEKLT